MPAVYFSDVVNAAYIRMGQLARDAHFGKEPLPAHWIIREFGRKELQCHRLAQLQIIRSINFPHSATSEKPYDAIAVGKDSPGRKSSCGDGVGGDNSPNVGCIHWSLWSTTFRSRDRWCMGKRTQRLSTGFTEPAIVRIICRTLRALDHRITWKL